MKNLILFAFLIVSLNYSKANIIYTDPVNNAKYVSVGNNIIIGFDEEIQSTDLSSVIFVTGSISGIHQGEVIITSDKKKLIFKPNQPFIFNERIDVKLNRVKTLNSLNKSLSFNFQTQINKPEWDYKKSFFNESGISNYSGNNDNPDTLNLPALTVTISNNPTPGDFYLSNFPFGPIPNTPYLLTANNSGAISYYKEVSVWGLDFKRQPNGSFTYFTNGKYYEQDIQHNVVDSFSCSNGYSTDNHELRILNNGHALLLGSDPETVDMSLIVPGGNPNAVVIGIILQELDENKNVVFQWRSWDHFLITDAQHIDFTAAAIDYMHSNAIELDNDGNILLSSRHLSEITKIDHSTGNTIWRLGGNNNQFTFVNDPIGFSYQHDIRRIPNGNVTLFDNGNYHSPPFTFSRAVEYQLDEVNKVATLVWQYRNSPDNFGFAMGSVQRLHNGNTLISWGAANPTITEVTPVGTKALEMTLPPNIYTYRTFKDEVNLTLNIKLALEGFYNTQNNKLDMNDTVTAYIRSINSPYYVIESCKSVIDSVNLTGNFRYYNVQSGNYYISIKHRNGLETWSKAGGESFTSRGVYLYDFTNSASNAYGNNLVQEGLKYCIYSGDINQDGNIDLTDIIMVSTDAGNFITGYVASDVNGDRVTDLADALITFNNSSNFVNLIRP